MAEKRHRHFRARDEVVVRPPREILSTLDADGTLDGLPFMPEMLSSCGKNFRVLRRVEKTCFEIAPGWLHMQRFPANDVVLLEEQRCSGDGHDGCRRGCMIFWKEAWLRRVSPGEPPIRVDQSQRELLREHLKVKTDSTHYFCQSTQLAAVTKRFPGKQAPWLVWVALREIWFGSRSVLEVVGLMARSVRRSILGDRRLRGPNNRTPTESLDLMPGEWVRIKSLPRILETLDSRQKNRGLGFSYAMTRNCGRRAQVERKVDRMINESTGEMREVHNTVALRGVECVCYYTFLGCPRSEFLYWREIWLERAENGRACASPPNTLV